MESNERKSLTLSQTLSKLRHLAKDNGLEWKDELDADFSNEVEFLLGSRGWWLLCHLEKEYPFSIKYRLVWYRNYEKVKPNRFMDVAIEMLYH